MLLISLSHWVIIVIIDNNFGFAVVEIYYIVYKIIDIYNINLL